MNMPLSIAESEGEMNRKPFDRYGTIPADLQALLDKSKDSVGDRTRRSIKCPQCGYVIMIVYGHSDIPILAHCKKCKFEDIINLGYFRTIRKRKKNCPQGGNLIRRTIR